MDKKKTAAKNPRPISKKKRQPLPKKTAEAQKADKRLSRRQRSGLKRYDQTLTSELYVELSILAKQEEADLRVFIETCLRSCPAVKRHLKENELQLSDRPARGNPATLKKK